MRLVTIDTDSGGGTAGVQLPDGAVVLADAALGAKHPGTVAGLFRAGPKMLARLDEAVQRLSGDRLHAQAEGSIVAAADVRLREPMGERVMLICAGANYRAHLHEMGEELPAKAAYFAKSPNSVIGVGQPIQIPPAFPDHVDWEGELCIVIGAPCHDVRAQDAWDYVGGYTLLNDVSARDDFPALAAARTPIEGRWAWTEMILGKQFPTFGPLGPAVVTADEIGDPAGLRLQTIVNGTVMQDTPISDLAVGIPALVEQFSKHYSFQPGDIISTGTPSGVGVGQRPPVFLHDGDRVTIRVDGIGDLTNYVTGPPAKPVGLAAVGEGR